MHKKFIFNLFDITKSRRYNISKWQAVTCKKQLKEILLMNNRAKRQYTLRIVLALTLVTLIIGLSTITTTAVVVNNEDIDGTVSITDESFETSVEYHLASGELLVTNIKDFAVSVDVIGAKSVTIRQSDSETTVKLAKGTVADALARAGITPDDSLIISPDTDTVIENDMTVTIKKVTYEEKTETQPIEFETVEKESDSLDAGETEVHQKGSNGEKQITKKIKYIDGEKVAEEVIDTKTIKEPVDEIIYVGAEKANTFVDQSGAVVAYKQVISGSGTAYTAPAGALTATGVAAYHGGVAVNPNIIPYGSKLYITSTDGSFVYGYATAVDTGGALMDGSAVVDCFYNTYDECVNFGRRNVNVYVL